MTTIRRATPDDVPGIAAVIRDAFQITIQQPYCRDLVAQGKYMIWVSEAGGEIAGFVSTFITTTSGGVSRWEVDLLAVRTNDRGGQLGTKLILAADAESQNRRVKFARGLIRVENIASQKAFQRAGYATNGHILNMYLWQPQASNTVIPGRGMIVPFPVETLTYRGLWLEGLDLPFVSEADKQAAVDGARAMVAREGRDNTSTLIAEDHPLPDDLIASARLHGQYQWWRKP
jgi:ribosomal protein S18 acetylase RimI-like enzyme